MTQTPREAAEAMREAAAKFVLSKKGTLGSINLAEASMDLPLSTTPPVTATAEGQDDMLVRAQDVIRYLTRDRDQFRADLARMKAAMEKANELFGCLLHDVPDKYDKGIIDDMRSTIDAALKGTPTTDAPYAWRDMKDVPKDQDVILYFSTGTCRVPLVARYNPGFMDPIGLVDWRVIQPIPGPAPTGWLPLIWKD